MIRDSKEYGHYEGRGGELYAADYPEIRSGEYEWLKQVAAEEGDPICELACGHGRLCLPLARLGYNVVGMDKSATLIELARQAALREPEHVRSKLSFMRGDLRHFELGQQFRYVFIFFGGFYHLERKDERLACLQHIHRHLYSGGLLEIEDPTVGPDSVCRKEMESLFQEAGFVLDAALQSHSLPLELAASDQPALLYRARRGC